MNNLFPSTRLFLILFICLAFPYILAAQCCDYVLIMEDSYGDGWNGAELEVSINGEVVGTYAAEDTGSNALITTCNGDEISLSYSSGDYENENTYVLLASAGVVIFSDGPEPIVGESGPLITDCELEAAPGTTPCSALQLAADDCITADNSAVLGTGFTPNCSEYQGGDIWYSIVVPESGNLVFQTFEDGGINDTGIQLWYGEDCLILEDGPCDDDGGTGYLSFLTASNLVAGETIYVQLWGYGGAAGSFELCVTDPGVIELEESRLPIFIIDTNGEDIPDEPKVDASLQIIYNGPDEINYITDDPTNYNGNIGIEIRGATSAGYPQTPYSFETRDELGENNNVSLVDMPAENDWVLLSNYNDKVLMRNLLASHLSERMGEYAPRVRLCEVIMNGDYQGIYAFGEKIKVDEGRVDIATLNE
ncbi:MAG: CotH kinase family protein, partial [Flavobacteriales bacterium]